MSKPPYCSVSVVNSIRGFWFLGGPVVLGYGRVRGIQMYHQLFSINLYVVWVIASLTWIWWNVAKIFFLISTIILPFFKYVCFVFNIIFLTILAFSHNNKHVLFSRMRRRTFPLFLVALLSHIYSIYTGIHLIFQDHIMF